MRPEVHGAPGAMRQLCSKCHAPATAKMTIHKLHIGTTMVNTNIANNIVLAINEVRVRMADC